MSVHAINTLLNSIHSTHHNNTGNVYVNVLKNTFIMLNGEIIIPRISVSRLSYDTAVNIVQQIIAFIPEFLIHHRLLEHRQPHNELHSLHFITPITGYCIDFYHVLRIDFKFSGDSSTIIEPGDNDFYPSYITNRLYYISRIVPTFKGTLDNPIQSIKLISSITTESDQYFHTYALFDDIDTTDITKQFAQLLPDIFTIPPALYSFISFDYSTACLNVLFPTPTELNNAIKIFEPLFFIIASHFIDVRNIFSYAMLEEYWKDILIHNDTILPNDAFIQELKHYFSRYSIYRDEYCMLKGWWQIVKHENSMHM